MRGRLAFVFQPAEEPLQGARAMLKTGLVQRLALRESYALHCDPFPAGTITVSPGHGLPGVDNIRIMLPGGDDAVTSELEKPSTVDVLQRVADYQAAPHTPSTSPQTS
ncbi:M20/M25/M40 family metallo-hydrolase [Actinoplanes sp. NPDC051861]|uniref:M20/M25/M40 family metallo-hydrolase n=1 Tax=Actinoplanes sp. NPDC051861 TaxID=3155170 RepID=UPI003444DCD6